MKKTIVTALAAVLALGMSATALAASSGVSGVLKNSVTGFAGGAKHVTQDLTQKGGTVEVAFDLGDNESTYKVEFDFSQGEELLDASYSRSKNAILLHPQETGALEEAAEFEMSIQVLDRKTLNTVADGYTLSGEMSFDTVQTVKSGHSYRNLRGSLYDFGEGVKNVQIDTGSGVVVKLLGNTSGMQNFSITTSGNKSIDYMFSKHELSYLNFAGNPRFSGEVQVAIKADENQLLYSYAGGKLTKVPDTSYENGHFVFTARALETFILSNAALSEGVVNEDKNTVNQSGSVVALGSAPSAGGAGFANSDDTGKENPGTGAPELF